MTGLGMIIPTLLKGKAGGLKSEPEDKTGISPFLLTVTVSPEEPKVQSVCLSHSVENGKCQESV